MVRSKTVDKDFVCGLSYRNKRRYREDFLSDIRDGEVYQNLLERVDFWTHPWNLALGFNTDGVSPYKSSTPNAAPLFASLGSSAIHALSAQVYPAL